jgi:anti-anti-sigma factor
MSDRATRFKLSRERELGDGPPLLIVSIAGDVDLSVSEELANALVPPGDGEGCAGVAVDMGQVTFMDSSGLHALLRAADALARARISLALVTPPGSSVARVLELAGVDSQFVQAGDLDEARQTLAARAQAG